ncbi:MAG TPA: hypothetical protein VK907_09480, partial [Phnomibacter sp.]|nr:hypothetical protein [Phnomibacter sp.]
MNTTRQTLLSVASSLLLLTGCIKDTLQTTYTYTLARPVYKTSAEVRNAIGNLPSEPVSAPGKMYIS